ncbi:MAG: hypothetical protein WAK48_03515 [Candidatus Acidiferrum sp.]|jgi:hypothetical protein
MGCFISSNDIDHCEETGLGVAEIARRVTDQHVQKICKVTDRHAWEFGGFAAQDGRDAAFEVKSADAVAFIDAVLALCNDPFPIVVTHLFKQQLYPLVRHVERK